MDELWSPILFSVSFDGVKAKPSWSLGVVDTPNEVYLDPDSYCFFEGVLCIYSVVLLCFSVRTE
jgi:hypothetical protein